MPFIVNNFRKIILHHISFVIFKTKKSQTTDSPLQILVHVVVAVVASQTDQNTGGTAALFLTTQAAVAHPSADGTRPRLQRKDPNSVCSVGH